MNNLEQFAFIRVLVATGEVGQYEEAMKCNYNLEENDGSWAKFISLSKWRDCKPEAINKLPVGTLFVGISKTDSMSREYVIIAKDTDTGEGIWYPLSGPDDAIPVVVVYECKDVGSKPICISEIDSIEGKLEALCEPGKMYISTDINRNILPLFGTDNDSDDDDDDDDDDLSEDESDVLHRLSEMAASDDEDEEEEDDDDDFDTIDCIFTVLLDPEGKKRFVTLAEGLNYDQTIHELKHRVEHATDDLEHATTVLSTLNTVIKNTENAKQEFMKVYEVFKANMAIETAPMEPIKNPFLMDDDTKPANDFIPTGTDDMPEPKEEPAPEVTEQKEEIAVPENTWEVKLPAEKPATSEDDQFTKPSEEETTSPAAKDDFAGW